MSEHKYDFDRVVDRCGTGDMKHECLEKFFGRTDLTPLWIADMDFECIPEIAEAICRRMQHPVFGYQLAPASYWQSIINWLRRRHGVKVSRQELTFSPGVVKSLAAAVNYYTKVGDKVIIQEPVYHPFRTVVEGALREVSNNRLRITRDGFEMDFDDLERRMADGARLMLLCNPHNPVGIQWSADTLQRVARLAKKYGVTVVSDEIHGDLMLWGGKHLPFTESCPEAAEVGVWLGAPSKTFNIPGFMSSWIVVRNPELRDPFFAWLDSTEANDPCFTATIAAEAAYTHGEEWLDQMLRYVEGNILAVEEFFASEMPAVKTVRPQASFLVWLDLRGLGLEHDALVDRLVNHAHLALNDGMMFGDDACGCFRLNVAAPRSVIMSACTAIKDAFASVSPRKVDNV